MFHFSKPTSVQSILRSDKHLASNGRVMLDAPVIVAGFIDSLHSFDTVLCNSMTDVSENPSSSLAIFPSYRTGGKLKEYIV